MSGMVLVGQKWRRLVGAASALAISVALLGAVGLPAQADNQPGDPQQSGPAQSGGGNLPGVKPVEETEQQRTSDAAPSINPGFVDTYSRTWKAVEADKERIKNLVKQLAGARVLVRNSSSDLALTMRVRSRASYNVSDAASQFSLAVRDLYIAGSTDVDIVLGVLGSQPEDLLRNLDDIQYLRSATGSETSDFEAAQDWAVIATSAAAAAQLRSASDRKRVDSVGKNLTKARDRLHIDQDELARLVAAASPQTVVSKSGCPSAVLDGTVPAGIDVKKLCTRAVKQAASPQAAQAIKWALIRLGAPYACEGIGRLAPWRYDCSSYVSRAYAEGAGLGTAGDGWAPSTRNMVPWDGASLDPHYAPIPPQAIRPGDLVLYDTCPAGEVCAYRHVVMYLGALEPGGVPMMAHTNQCGGVAHVEPFIGTDAANFLGVRRVVALGGEKIKTHIDKPEKDLEKAGGGAAANQPTKGDKPVKGDKGDKPSNGSKPGKPDKPGKADKPANTPAAEPAPVASPPSEPAEPVEPAAPSTEPTPEQTG